MEEEALPDPCHLVQYMHIIVNTSYLCLFDGNTLFSLSYKNMYHMTDISGSSHQKLCVLKEISTYI